MTVLFERSFRYRDSAHRAKELRFSVDLDDAAIVRDQLQISVKGAARELPSGDWREETLDLTGDFARSVLEVRLRGSVIATVPLTLPIADSSDFHGKDIDVIADEVAIDGALGPTAIENIIHLIPGDPFFGCIIKSAASTVIGQTIRCWRSTNSNAPIGQRIKDIGGCLKEFGVRMALTFMFRAGRCALSAGLF